VAGAAARSVRALNRYIVRKASRGLVGPVIIRIINMIVILIVRFVWLVMVFLFSAGSPTGSGCLFLGDFIAGIGQAEPKLVNSRAHCLAVLAGVVVYSCSLVQPEGLEPVHCFSDCV